MAKDDCSLQVINVTMVIRRVRVSLLTCSFHTLLTLDVDECLSNLDNCSNNATCTNTIGSFNCSCNRGYQGNGTTCIGEYLYLIHRRFLCNYCDFVDNIQIANFIDLLNL